MGRYETWRFADLAATPWRNGGGQTYEIAVEPLAASMDDFDWRISIAEVRAAGPFSRFDGIDRQLTLLEGASMQLTIDGEHHALQTLSTVAFAGESDTSCEIPDGPTRDLNVMTRRDRAAATVELVEVTGATEIAPAWRLVMVCVSGSVSVGECDLAALDGVRSEELALPVDGAGIVAVIRLTPADAQPEPV